ncbi:hypothetical protein KW823_21490 [Enterobacter quasiroggenkampii]|nr:hypothetical protein [Enterobacter quasiroggenkampii]
MKKFESGAFQERVNILVESVRPKQERQNTVDHKGLAPATLFTLEDADNAFANLLLEAVAKKSAQDDRGAAAAAVIEWAQSGDATWDSFESLAFGIALESEGLDPDDIESDDDITDGVVDSFNDALANMADAAVTFGADSDDVATLIDEEDDDAASEVMNALADIDDEEAEELIAAFTVGEDLYESIKQTETNDSQMLLEATKKVVRDGKVKLIKKRPRPKKLNSAQRSALKKARRKSHTSAARMKRRKSMKIRKKRFGK